MLFYVAFQWGGAMKNGSMTFFCQWVMDNSFFNTASLGDAWGMSQSLLAVLGAIPMAVAAIFVVPLANKFGKRLTCLVGMAIGVAGGVIAGLGGSNIIPVAIGIALKCLGSSPACYLILAMLADVIDHIEYTRGIRTDGLTMSVYSALMVAATPVCNAIFSGILNASGYDQSADVALNTLGQSAAVNTAISVSYIWVETAAYALCAVLVFLWTVEKNLPAEQAAIVERKKEPRNEVPAEHHQLPRFRHLRGQQVARTQLLYPLPRPRRCGRRGTETEALCIAESPMPERGMGF